MTTQCIYEVTAEETDQVNGGGLLVPSETVSAAELRIKPIRYYTLAIGEDGGDLPELLTM